MPYNLCHNQLQKGDVLSGSLAMSSTKPRVRNLPIMGMFACTQDQREMFEYLPTVSFKAGVSKYALFIIGLLCELDRLNGKKTLKNLVAILYYCFH